MRVLNRLGKGSTLLRFKQSLSSLYRALLLAFEAYRNLPHLRSLTFGTCIDGVAGCGKSTMIREMDKKSHMCLVCKTRSAVESHATSGFSSALTVEAAGLQDIACNTIVVDEVSMITNVELAALIDKPNMVVHLYGDSNQIGVKDMSDIKGVRDEGSQPVR